MPRLITAVAVIAATSAVPAASQGVSIDMRCVETDQAMTQRVRGLLAQQDWHVAGTTPLHLVITRMAAARFDCKHGRIERGLQTYAAADATLTALEESAMARTARSGDAALDR